MYSSEEERREDTTRQVIVFLMSWVANEDFSATSKEHIQTLVTLKLWNEGRDITSDMDILQDAEERFLTCMGWL